MRGELTLRKKIIIIITTVIVAATVAAWLLIYRMESRLLIQSNSAVLSRYLDAFERAGKNSGIAEIKLYADLWNNLYPDGRLTLLDLDGGVLLDSSNEPGILDNHYRRPEVIDAMRSGFGSDLRFSATMEEWLNYSARTIEIMNDDGYRTYVIRLAFPVDKLKGLAQAAGVGFIASIAVVLALVWLLCYWMLRQVMKPLSELNSAAEAIAEGQPARFPVTNSVELRKLSDVLNTMHDSLHETVEQEADDKRRLVMVFESLPIGVIILDKQKKITFINRTGLYLCGIAPQDKPALGTSMEIVLPTVEMCKMVYAPDSTKMISTDSHGGMYLEVSVVSLNTEKMIVIHDLTEKIHLDEARRDFFIDAGHEFQTPLAVIRMGLELLGDGSVLKNQDDKDMVHRLIIQQERISKLVDDLLFLVKLDADPLKVQYERIDANQLTKELTDDMKEVPYAKHVKITYDAPDDGQSILYGRPEDIRRALFNLLENACKYVSTFRREGGRVNMSITDDSLHWVVDVDDNGPGVPESERETIFQRFRRGEEHRARRGISAGGYGLGLSISRRIAERHGGTLELMDDARLGGASFRMILPKRDPNAS